MPNVNLTDCITSNLLQSSAGRAVRIVTSWLSVEVLWEDVLDVVVGVVRVIETVKWVRFPVVLLLGWGRQLNTIYRYHGYQAQQDVFHVFNLIFIFTNSLFVQIYVFII